MCVCVMLYHPARRTLMLAQVAMNKQYITYLVKKNEGP